MQSRTSFHNRDMETAFLWACYRDPRYLRTTMDTLLSYCASVGWAKETSDWIMDCPMLYDKYTLVAVASIYCNLLLHHVERKLFFFIYHPGLLSVHLWLRKKIHLRGVKQHGTRHFWSIVDIWCGGHFSVGTDQPAKKRLKNKFLFNVEMSCCMLPRI